ncbi:MAG: alpha/beta hydrolase [Bacteriovorax sp.]|nr:alpha/beta hydrolase [Bacteriovorax sp.]
MLSKTAQSKMIWKKLSESIDVTHFTSKSHSQQIYLKKIKAKKKSKAPVTIFLFHDMASYHGRFMNMISWFQVQHPEVSFVMMDFLGHGLSSGTRGHITKFSDLVDDTASVFEMLNKDSNEQWVALGHGVGALALLDLINRFDSEVKDKIDKVILSNFFLNFPSVLLQLQNKIFENFPIVSNALKTSRPVEIYLPEEILSDSHEQGLYLEDPLIVRRPTHQTLKIVTAKVKSIYQDAYFLDRPTLLLKSESPYLIGRAMDSFAKGLKKGILTEKKYSNLKHDLYNERDNISVFNDIAEWVQS